MKITKIFNAKIITPYRILDNGYIIIEDGRISQIGSEGSDSGIKGSDSSLKGRDHEIGSESNLKGMEHETGSDYTEINAGGLYVSPGFIDIHTHGGGGHDFMDGTVEAYLGAAEMHAKHGTTSMVPTTLTSTNEELKNTFKVFDEVKQLNKNGAHFLGLHLEGPYFSMEQRGAQDPQYIKNPNPDDYNEILSWTSDIIRWSCAPELDGALEFGREMKKRGILVSAAHTDAISEQVEEAFENGFTHITHLYSGMSGVRRINAYRYAGAVEAAFLIDDMTVEIIADGCHLPASLLKLIYKIKGPSNIALITDSMRGAGMPDGFTILGSLKNGQKVIIEDGVAKLLDRSAFAGSVATADRLVRTMTKLADVPVTEAVRMMTATPARIIGCDRCKGTLEVGKDADVIMFDDDINIRMTMVGGVVVHSA